MIASLTERLIGLKEYNNAWFEKPKHLWKYYLNLSGCYHPLDEVIEVTSLDTLEKIRFDAATLTLHPATRYEYRYGSSYYNDLIKRYPDKEYLIISMLSPVDINRAINANDFTILNWDSRYIEDGEINLPERLQEHIIRYVEMWPNRDYLDIDTSYGYHYLHHFYSQLVNLIEIARIENCKTTNAHSFHIWEYLDSHARLARYKDVLTRKQVLYLYKNIERIQSNAGKNEIFEELIQIFLTERNIPLYGYSALHNTKGMPESLTPTVDMVRQEINYPINALDASSIETIEEIMEREAAVSGDKGLTLEQDIAATNQQFTYALSGDLTTRVLESELADNNFLYEYSFDEWLLNEWAVLAFNNQYQARIAAQNPSNGDLYSLTMQNAFILYMYCYFKAQGITLEYLPIFNTTVNVVRTYPTLQALETAFDTHDLPVGYLEALYNDLVLVYNIRTTDDFYKTVNDIHQRWTIHRRLWLLQDQPNQTSIGEILTANLYSTCVIKLSDTPMKYTDWLYRNSIDVVDNTVNDFSLLAEEIFSKSTGKDLNAVIDRATIQKSMLEIVEQLSGYNIQIITIPPQNEVFSLGRKSLRFGDLLHEAGSMNGYYLNHGVYLNTLNEISALTEETLHLEISPLIGEPQNTLHVDSNELLLPTLNTRLDYTPEVKGGGKLNTFHHGMYLNGLEISPPPVVYQHTGDNNPITYPNVGQITVNGVLLPTTNSWSPLPGIEVTPMATVSGDKDYLSVNRSGNQDRCRFKQFLFKEKPTGYKGVRVIVIVYLPDDTTITWRDDIFYNPNNPNSSHSVQQYVSVTERVLERMRPISLIKFSTTWRFI